MREGETEDHGRSTERGGGFLTGLLLGGLGGVVLAMLATPQSGEHTRDLLVAKAREAADRARDTAADAGGIIPESIVERGRSILDAARSRIEGAITEGRDAAQRQRAELQDET
jgi:gas vesicle protein